MKMKVLMERMVTMMTMRPDGVAPEKVTLS